MTLLGDFEDGQEGFLRDIHAADALHALLALLLLFKELALAGDVAAITLGDYVLAHRRDIFARDDLGADGRLQAHFKLLPRDELLEFLDQRFAALVGAIAMDDHAQ